MKCLVRQVKGGGGKLFVIIYKLQYLDPDTPKEKQNKN